MKSDFLNNWNTQMRKGLLPFFVLDILYTQEQYGYELIQALQDRYDIEVTESTIYPLLIRLMKEELLVHKWVEQKSGIPRKYYYISKTGKAVYKEMKTNISDVLTKITSIKTLGS